MSAFVPHPYQVYAIDRILRDPSVGLMLDMGLGKTAIVLQAVDRLLYDALAVSKVLVIAPKKVAEATWQTEAAKWDNLCRLRLSTVLGSRPAREKALAKHADIYITNRDIVPWLCEEYFGPASGRAWPFDMVVVDESSSFKNPQAHRFKALRRMLPRISRMVILTGTPAPGGVEDLWAQVFLLDRGARLEKTLTAFRAKYLDHNPWRHEFKAKPGAFDAVKERIGDICISMSAADYLQLPEMTVHDFLVRLDAAAKRAYETLEKQMVLEVPEGEISAMNAASLTGKLLQLCGGAVYSGDGSAPSVHSGKLDALEELIEALHGEKALLFYGFKHELPRIVNAIRHADKDLRVRKLESAQDAADWNAGEIDVLLAHPASCAYGLNLQQGGRHIIWYTLTWSLELYQQANARLYRQGQRLPVIVHRLLVQGGMDEDVAAALEGKADTQDALLRALKAKIEKYGGRTPWSEAPKGPRRGEQTGGLRPEAAAQPKDGRQPT